MAHLDKCLKCGVDTDDLDFLGRCTPCFRKDVMSTDRKERRFRFGSVEAHNDDIRRRKISPEDGRSVYRDYGRKSFVRP